MESNFTKCDEITQAKIMSGLEEHGEGSYVFFLLPSVQFWPILL